MRSGAPSATSTGRRSTSPTRKDESVTTNLARADTTIANGASSNCCGRPEPRESLTTSSRSLRMVSRPKPTGRTCVRRRRTSATRRARTLLLAAAPRSEERRVGKECRSLWSADHEKERGEAGRWVGGYVVSGGVEIGAGGGSREV